MKTKTPKLKLTELEKLLLLLYKNGYDFKVEGSPRTFRESLTKRLSKTKKKITKKVSTPKKKFK